MTRLAGAIGLAALAGALFAEAAAAQPARIILLRHGEKQNGAELCVVGTLRAEGLAAQYLGKDAPGNEILYGKGGKPDAFFAVTPHTQETAKPSADSWGLQLTVFSVPPKDPNEETDLGAETQKAAAALEFEGLRRQDRRHRLGAQAHRQKGVEQGRRHLAGASKARRNSRRRRAQVLGGQQL